MRDNNDYNGPNLGQARARTPKGSKSAKQMGSAKSGGPRTPQQRRTNGVNSTTPSSDKFAWSKCQSSPEPSELPIPRFLKIEDPRPAMIQSSSKKPQMRILKRPEPEEKEVKVDNKPQVTEEEDGESLKLRMLKDTFSKLLGQSPVTNMKSAELISGKKSRSSSPKLRPTSPTANISSLKSVLGVGQESM